MVYPNISAIRENRIKAGFSMRALAMKAGVNYSTLSLIEKNGKNVMPTTAKAICDALQKPFEELFEIKEA